MPIEILRQRMLYNPFAFESVDSILSPTALSASAVSPAYAQLSQDTWKDNCTLSRHGYKFDADFSVFLWNLIQLQPVLPEQIISEQGDGADPCLAFLLPPETERLRSSENIFVALELVTRFVFDTHLRSHPSLCTNPNSSQKSGSSPAPVAGRTTAGWVSYLQGIFQHPNSLLATQASEWLLSVLIDPKQHDRWLLGFVLHCPEPSNRQAFSDIVLSACKQLAPAHRQWYSAAGFGSAHPSILVRFIDKILMLLLRATHHWRRFHHYFAFLTAFARIGPAECNLLLDKHLVSELVCFSTGLDSPFLSKRVKAVVLFLTD